MNNNIIINREWAMPSSQTFSIKPIKKFIKKHMITNGIVIDPFANNNSIKDIIPKNVEYISNDLNPIYNTDYHLDAVDFLKTFKDNSVDMILYDPPYSPRQVSECYKDMEMSVNMSTTQSSYWSKQKAEISRVLKNNGIVITFGWNSGGIGIKYGCSIKEILMVAHGGWHNDTICTLELKDNISNK